MLLILIGLVCSADKMLDGNSVALRENYWLFSTYVQYNINELALDEPVIQIVMQ